MRCQALTRVTLAALAFAGAAAAGWADTGAQSGHACAEPARRQAAGAATHSTDDPTQAPALEPRTRVAGLDSLRVTSSIRFADPTAAQHVFEVSLAFPGRARLALRPVGGELGQRVLRYARCGEVYGFGYREATSTRLEGALRVDELLSLEARRAAFVWPEAHAWSGDGNEQRARVADLGTLVVELAPSAVSSPMDPAGERSARELRPRRIRALRSDGSEVEALEITGWGRIETREGARAWPQGLRLSAAGTSVWDETVLHIERPFPWADDWFVPPDRRVPRDTAVPGLRSIDLTSAVVREVQVPRTGGRPMSLDAALTFAREAAAEERARGHLLDQRTTLVLSRALEPRAVRLELADEGARIPEGWRLEAPQPAWLVFFDAVDEVTERDVARLLTAPNAAPGTEPTIRLIVTDEPRGGVQLLLVDTPRSADTPR